MNFFYNAEPENAGEWRRLLTSRLPDLRFVDRLEAIDPAEVDYLLTWEPLRDMQRYERLRVLFSAGAGVDQFDLSQIPERVSMVRMVDASLAGIMVEYVLFAVLALHRDMLAYRIDQAAEVWSPRTILPASSRRVGVMGIGQLGRAALEKLRMLDFQLLGWNRSSRIIDGVQTYAGNEQLPEFLSQCDILVNLLPLTEQTRGLLDRHLFGELPRGAGLVNVGRGAHVNETDLLAALDAGQLGGAVLDVFQNEPLARANPLWKHPRVWVTPHIASTMQVEGGAAVVAENIRRDSQGQPLLHRVDRRVGY